MTIKFPLPALTSITHRVSGIILFVVVGLALAALQCSLESPEGFQSVKSLFSLPLAKLLIWLMLCALAYHFVAGLKHLVMDMGIGETKVGGYAGAWITILASIVLFVVAGVWIWA